ncbi:MAG: hypothetical protein RL670_763 [Actinomycetota bacterium]|jgi:5-formyltetrahydrofolate cyclo-ligase
MTQPTTAEIKNALRRELTERRNLGSLQNEVARDFTANLIQLAREQKANCLACYLSYGSEPETDGFLKWALENSIRVMLPVAHDDGEMTWVYFDGQSTKSSIYGFAEAIGEPANLVDAELILVPALAADTAGNRLGKGKGYYDRALDASIFAPTYAVVYETEVLAEIASEPHDRKIDGIVTDARIIKIQN